MMSKPTVRYRYIPLHSRTSPPMLTPPLRFVLLEVGVDLPEPLAERDPFVQQGTHRRRGSGKEGRIAPPFPVPKGGIIISRGAIARLVGGDYTSPFPRDGRL